MGDDDPFKGMGFFGDLARLFQQQQQGPVSWDAARHLAASIATEGQSEPNVDPVVRIQLEQLARVAELHVTQATNLQASHSGAGVSIVPVTRTQWTQRSMDALRDLFEALAGSLSGGLRLPEEPLDADDAGDPMAAMLGQLMQMLGPMMLGMTAGSMLGHLARCSFGQYDLPIPRPQSDQLMVVVPNLDAFGEEWSLPADDLRLWVCVHEVAHHAVLTIPHVRERLDSLLRRYVSGFEPDASALEDRIGNIELTDPSNLAGLQDALGDPEVLLGAIRSPAQRALLPQLEALVAAIVGYVDYVMDTVGGGLIGSYDMLTEAMRRRRVTADPSDRFVERLLGLELTQSAYDRGAAFVNGIAERAGSEGVERLWRSERELPTPAEVDAPGLWLARIDIE
jgi:putative hydrolase